MPNRCPEGHKQQEDLIFVSIDNIDIRKKDLKNKTDPTKYSEWEKGKGKEGGYTALHHSHVGELLLLLDGLRIYSAQGAILNIP